MIVQWSDEDQLFLVTIPEFSDRVVMPCTHGKTRTESIRNGEEVIEMYIEPWQAEGQSFLNPVHSSFISQTCCHNYNY
jgi:predicted RNase H-like HicB family nuclease